MSTLFSLLFLASGGAFILGLIRPNLVKMGSRGKSTLVYGGGAIALAIATTATAPAEQTQQPKQTEQTDRTNAETETEQQPKVYSVGETIDHKKWSVTIKQISYKQELGGQFGEKAKGKYAVVFASVKNGTKETASLPGSFKVEDNQGRTFEGIGTGSFYAAYYDADPIFTQVPPGTSAKTMMAFDLAPNAESPKLIWNPGMFSSQEYKIEL